MQFTPSDCLYFDFIPNSHLQTNLIIKNTSNNPINFKVRVSSTQKFNVKPNIGFIKPGATLVVSVAIHRQLIETIENQKVQILYGEKYEEAKNFSLAVENGSKKTDKLNLTMIVREKEEQNTKLKKQIEQYRSIPMNTLSSSKGGKSSIMTYAVAAIGGVIVGFIVPFQIFGN